MRRNALLGLLLLYLLYAGAFVFRTSFLVDGTRHFCLFDDAMISMRYARNLAQGYGPVFNPGGERVEGYTNPLWMLAMATAHLLPLPAAKVPLVIQIAEIALLACNLLVVERIARYVSGDSATARIGPVVLTAFYLPLNNWALQGMEVGPATLLVSLAVWKAFQSMEENRLVPLLYWLLAAAVLLRMDLLIPAALICGYLVVRNRGGRRHLLASLVALGAPLAAQTAFRAAYYGELLPNTYYLKMSGYPAFLRIARGMLVLGDFVGYLGWLFFLLPLVLLALRRDRYVGLLSLVFGGQLAYSVYVGGDAWEWWGGANRYISVAMPLFFVLFCSAVEAVAERASPASGPTGRLPAWSRIGRPCLSGFVVVVALLHFNALKGPQSLRQWALLERPMLVQRNRRMVQRAYLLRNVTRPTAKIALVWAGIVPYYADRQTVDISGKNDRYIGRLPMHRSPSSPEYAWFLPGHLKWDYAHSLGRLRPDVAFQVDYPPGEARPYLAEHYRLAELGGFEFHLRRRSANILWDRVREVAER